METRYIQELEDIGLSDKEARAYVALLELGRGSAASVANRSGLKPPTAYVVLKALIDKGFARRFPRAKKQLFIPESPTTALTAAEQRFGNFRSVVPDLESLAKKSAGGKTRTLFFEGFAGMKQAYEYRIEELKGVEYLAFFASAEDIPKKFEEYLYEWNEHMTKFGATSRAIVPEHPSLARWRKRDAEFGRRVKIVPAATYSAKNAIEIFPEFVRIALYPTLQCTIIEDAEFARAFRQIFEINWAALQ